MSKKTKALVDLRRAAEQASGLIRDVASDLDRMADELGRGKRTQALELRLAADRLKATATLLTAEVNASAFGTLGLVAKVGQSALVGAGAVALAFTTGIGEGAGQELYDHLRSRSDSAVECLAEVERQASVLVDEQSDADGQLPAAHVLAGEGTGWVVSYEGDRGVQQVEEYGRQADATDRAIAVVSERGGGEVVIHDSAGLVDRRMIVHETGSPEERRDGSQNP
jgi:hypothetical protein